MMRRQRSHHPMAELLECRRLLFASIPSGYEKIAVVQIRPKAGTYDSGLTLTAGTTYVLRASGEAYSTTGTNTNEAGETYDGDIEFPASSTVTTWGVAVTAGNLSSAASGWGDAQTDHVYSQSITPGSSGDLAFTWTTDGTVAVSTIAVAVYAPVPHVTVGMIRTNQVVGSVDVTDLPDNLVTMPVNNADFDHNGVADNTQPGRVVNDGFLLPVTLPAVTGSTSHNHYTVIVPKAFRAWLNADRTGSIAGVGLRETNDRTVYLEARAELPRGSTADITIQESYDGTIIDQLIPVSTFQFTGPTTVAAGAKGIYGSDATTGKFSTAVGGSLDVNAISTTRAGQFTNVYWSDSPVAGYVDFRVNGDFIWGLPVVVD